MQVDCQNNTSLSIQFYVTTQPWCIFLGLYWALHAQLCNNALLGGCPCFQQLIYNSMWQSVNKHHHPLLWYKTKDLNSGYPVCEGRGITRALQWQNLRLQMKYTCQTVACKTSLWTSDAVCVCMCRTLYVFDSVKEATATAAAGLGSKMCARIFVPDLVPSFLQIPMIFCRYIPWVVLECSAKF